ncbi:MAG: Uma2 family endonuclease [Cyanobacteria bacterium J06560_6]
MTYALTRYKSYQEYLDDESLSSEGNYRLLSTGELIEVSEEDDLNVRITYRLIALLLQLENGRYLERVRNGNKEIQVRPVGDKRVNRKPDLVVLRSEHLETARQAILLDASPPLFVAEVVSPGSENSENYKRDYIWKRQQYEDMGIPEYWIIDPHREKVTLLTLIDGTYIGREYVASERIVSKIFPTLSLNIRDLLRR